LPSGLNKINAAYTCKRTQARKNLPHLCKILRKNARDIMLINLFRFRTRDVMRSRHHVTHQVEASLGLASVDHKSIDYKRPIGNLSFFHSRWRPLL